MSVKREIHFPFRSQFCFMHPHQTSVKDDYKKSALIQWLSSVEMNTTTRVQILDEAVCISHS